MIDLKIDPLTGDLVFENGDFSTVTGDDELNQRLAMRLRLIFGEWFLNRQIGVDYWGKIFGTPDFVAIDSELTRVILSTDGVARLAAAIQYDFDKTNFNLSATFEVVKTDGDALTLNLPLTDVTPI